MEHADRLNHPRRHGQLDDRVVVCRMGLKTVKTYMDVVVTNALTRSAIMTSRTVARTLSIKLVALVVFEYIAPQAFEALTKAGCRDSERNVGRWTTGMCHTYVVRNPMTWTQRKQASI